MPSSTADRRRALAAVTTLGVAAAMVLALRLMGRLWWCECGTPRAFIANPGTSHSSQHLADWYSFSHVLHGVIFYWALLPLRKRLGVGWRLSIAAAVEAVWEVVENTPWIIDRYRNGTAAVGYVGDSIVNSTGDLGFCLAGFAVAAAVGWRWSIALFVGAEVLMLIAIRDNLTLNVVMLLWPVEAIRDWQGGG